MSFAWSSRHRQDYHKYLPPNIRRANHVPEPSELRFDVYHYDNVIDFPTSHVYDGTLTSIAWQETSKPLESGYYLHVHSTYV